MKIKTSLITLTFLAAVSLGLFSYSSSSIAGLKSKPCDQRGAGKVLDEAKCAGRTAESLPG
ncbi:MAG: hypothetical protein ACXWTW_04780, partial [Methylobacter sp.]